MTEPIIPVNEIEIWKPVVGYEGLYEVSSRGKLRRIGPWKWRGKTISPPPRIHSDKLCADYVTVAVTKDGKRRSRILHRLVAESFLGPIPEGKEVNHIDGDRTNNRPSNLEYVTPQENADHAVRLGLRQWGDRVKTSSITNIDASEIKWLIQKGIPQKEIENIYKPSKWCLKHMISGRSWRKITPPFKKPDWFTHHLEQ